MKKSIFIIALIAGTSANIFSQDLHFSRNIHQLDKSGCQRKYFTYPLISKA
jgi:hypothetical protein